ncbi:pep2-like protein [Apiospora saccharicola]
MIVVNPTVGGFDIPESKVEKYPSGYRYLCWCEDKVGHPPKLDLSAHGPERDILYKKCKDWLEGNEVKPNLTGNDIIDY